jgi:hypothetical protein
MYHASIQILQHVVAPPKLNHILDYNTYIDMDSKLRKRAIVMVMDRLDTAQFDYTHDAVITYRDGTIKASHKYRPCFYISMHLHKIIVELDTTQARGSSDREHKRLHAIISDIFEHEHTDCSVSVIRMHIGEYKDHTGEISNCDNLLTRCRKLTTAITALARHKPTYDYNIEYMNYDTIIPVDDVSDESESSDSDHKTNAADAYSSDDDSDDSDDSVIDALEEVLSDEQYDGFDDASETDVIGNTP